MIELAKHIENLLLENDCVILPDFGGFVAHYTEATYDVKNQLFMPPMRTIGFNPQLRLNDGLLAQSVMEVYGTNYGEAQKMVRQWVNQLKEKLYEDGSVELVNVGQLRMSIRSTVDFMPYNSRLTTSWLYGLGSFEMPRLSEKPQVATDSMRQGSVLMPHKRVQGPRVRRLDLRPVVRLTPAMLQGAAAVVAVLILFFFFSVPVKNTEVPENGNYAQLMPSELFNLIEMQSVAIHEVSLPQDSKGKKPVIVESATIKKQEVKQQPKPEQSKPVSGVSTPAPAPAPASTPAPNPAPAPNPVPTRPVKSPAKPAVVSVPAESKDYHIIVASVATEQDAHSMVEKLQSQGYREARVIVRDGKNRVSLRSLPSQAAAYHAVNELREGEKFVGVWVLHCKVK